MLYQNIKIQKLKHATFLIEWQGKIIYLDPFHLSENLPKADYVFITHEHFDHYSPEDLRKITKDETKFISIREVTKNLNNSLTVEPNGEYKLDNFSFKTIPAYNINKFREPGKVFHPKEDSKVGYILNLDNVLIYHAGDTDFIEEMKELKNINIALVPVSGTYVMTPEEATEAVNIFQPEIAVPMHYGEIVGTIDDAQKFKELAKVKVIIDED